MKNNLIGFVCLLAAACGGQSMTKHGGNVGDDDSINNAGSGNEPSTGGSSGTKPTSRAGTGGKSTSSTGGSSVGGSSHAGHSTGGTNSAGAAGTPIGSAGDTNANEGGSSNTGVSVCGEPIADTCVIEPGDSRFCFGDTECVCSDGATPTTDPCTHQDGDTSFRCTCPEATGNGGEGGGSGEGEEASFTVEFKTDVDPWFLIAGYGVPWTYGTYTVQNNTDEDISVTTLTLTQTNANGKMTDFKGVIWGNAFGFGGRQIDPKTADQELNYESLSDKWIVAPAHGSTDFPVQYFPAESVVSSSVAGPDSPQSGDTPQLEITKMTGVSTSGKIIEAKVLPRKGPMFVVRKSIPWGIQTQDVSSTQLIIGNEMELNKSHFTVPNTGPIGVKQIAYDLTVSGVTLNNFRMFKGDVELSPGSDIFITDAEGRGLDGQANSVTSSQIVFVRFNAYEEVISGSGSTFTLKATPVVVSPYGSVQVKLARLSNKPVTGYVGDDGLQTGLIAGLGVDTSVPPDGTIDEPAGLLWSDVSEIPHSPSLGTLSGSRDWTTEAFVDLGGITILTAS